MFSEKRQEVLAQDEGPLTGPENWQPTPTRCPHCGVRALERDRGEPGSVAYRCDDCGALCRRASRGGAWEIEPRPGGDEREWFTAIAPRLRAMRREMRPR